MDGRAYLEKVIADRWAKYRAQPVDDRITQVNLWEIQGLAAGLVAAGTLSQQNSSQILADLRERMRRAGIVKSVQLHGASSFTVNSSSFVSMADGIEEASSPELVRVLSLAGRTFMVGDVTASLVSLEVWTTMLVVRTAYPSDREQPPKRLPGFWEAQWRWRGWDDLGTQYRSNSGGSSNGPELVFDDRTFEPGPPEDAHAFTMIAEHPHHQVFVELPLVARS